MGAITAFALLTILLWVSPTKPDLLPQPRQNMWKTLAQSLGQDHICLSADAAEDPLSSCLVGVPLPSDSLPSIWKSTFWLLRKATDPTKDWYHATKTAPNSTDPPLHFQLLGSTNASVCIYFRAFFSKVPQEKQLWVQPRGVGRKWCNTIRTINGPSSPDSSSRELPQGIYLVCGDQAWKGIPPHMTGGPCTLGHISLFTPSATKLGDWQYKIPDASIRSKRELTDLGPDCDSQIVHWNKAKRVAVSVFLPWVSARKALGELGQVECWMVKQANLTSVAISNLLSDERITRQAALQNRAAVDYLLLLHHHKCEEFEGLCCFNLTSKAENVQSALDKIEGLVHEIKQETKSWVEDLFSGLGLSGWAGSILKDILVGLFVVVVAVFIGCSIVWALLKRLISRATSSPTVNIATLDQDPEYIPMQDLSEQPNQHDAANEENNYENLLDSPV